MDKIVIADASILIKLFSRKNEQLVVEAEKFYDFIRQERIQVFTPAFLLVEVLNALSIAKKFDEGRASDALRQLRDSGITFVNFNIADTDKLTELRYRHKLTAYDALYLLLAANLGWKLVTEDKKLLKVKKHCLGLKSYLQGVL